jgi:hypothetical integral membrane protein (TIGR02206 family)
MITDFRLPGTTHFLILAAVPLLAAVLALMQRRWLRTGRWLRISLGALLLADYGFWYAYLASIGQPIFPAQLPLELCDITLFLTAFVLFTLSPAIFDLSYYWSLAGTTMALLTPNLWERFPSVATVQFFVAHGLVASATLYLVWSGQARPRRGSVLRAMLAVNCIAAFDGVFDAVFKTDYMYLRAKPENTSLLNILGPWPLYIVASELVALAIFLLLYLPFRRMRRGVNE